MKSLQNKLSKQVDKKSTDNLDDHLANVMSFLMTHYPDNALQKFEEASFLLKQRKLDELEKWLKTQDMRNYKHAFASS